MSRLKNTRCFIDYIKGLLVCLCVREGEGGV